MTKDATTCRVTLSLESHKLFLLLLRSELNYCFIIHVDEFAYNLVAISFALKCFNCGEEGHLAKTYR